MSRYLTYTTPARGHLYPIVPTLLELRRRGHEVAVRTLASEVPALQALGLEAAPLARGADAPVEDFRGRTLLAKERLALDAFLARAPHEREDLARAIEQERPDALLVDVNSWGAPAAAERSGLRWARWCPFLWPAPSRDAPPFGLGLRPARGRAGRLRDRALNALLSRRCDRQLLPRVNEVRAGAGLPPLGNVFDLLERAPLTLHLSAEPFEYPRSDWPAGLELVGPGVWDPPAEAPAWLGESGRPLVLVTMSSEYQDDGKLVATALAALADEPVEVVATTIDTDPAAFDVPANARVERFLPHRPLLDRAACVVCHGGMGITQKALSQGVPACVVPFGRDQYEVARRVEVAGAGSRLPAPLLSERRLRRAVQTAIARRAGAERMAAAFRAGLEALQAREPAEVRLLGPAEAPVFRLKGYYRYHFQLQSPRPGTLHKLLREVMPALQPPTGVELTLDVDPFNML